MKYQAQFTNSDVEIESVTTQFKGFFKIDEVKFKHAMFEGGVSDVVRREVLERGHAVAVLPYDPKLNRIVFIEQFRIGAVGGEKSPWLLEVVAGMIDKNESKEQVAIREAHEEAGLEVDNLIPMLNYLSSPGGTSERIFVYLAIVDSSVAGGVHGLAHEQEDIKVQVLDYEEGMSLLEKGVIDNAATVIALQWLALHKSRIDHEYK